MRHKFQGPLLKTFFNISHIDTNWKMNMLISHCALLYFSKKKIKTVGRCKLSWKSSTFENFNFVQDRWINGVWVSGRSISQSWHSDQIKTRAGAILFPLSIFASFWEVNNRDCQVICSFLCQENKVLNTSLLYIQVWLDLSWSTKIY